MKARHFLQVTSEIIEKHRHRPQGFIEPKTEAEFLRPRLGHGADRVGLASEAALHGLATTCQIKNLSSTNS
jgi:hypothetical protein